MGTSQLSFVVAFLAGVASFLSPCVLALVPIYLAQLVGQGVYHTGVIIFFNLLPFFNHYFNLGLNS